MKLSEYLFCTELKNRDILKIDLTKNSDLIINSGYLNFNENEIKYTVLDKTNMIIDGWDLMNYIGDININFVQDFIERIIEENRETEIFFTNLYGKDIYLKNRLTNEYEYIEFEYEPAYEYERMFLKNIDGIDFYDEIIKPFDELPILAKGHFYLVDRKTKNLYENRLDVVVPIKEEDSLNNKENENKFIGLSY